MAILNSRGLDMVVGPSIQVSLTSLGRVSSSVLLPVGKAPTEDAKRREWPHGDVEILRRWVSYQLSFMSYV
jgi:hypothetical protein